MELNVVNRSCRLFLTYFMFFCLISWTKGTTCPNGTFGWQCKYTCTCDTACNRTTGHCENCPELTWGPGCLLASSCRYNDERGIFYQGKESMNNNLRECILWEKVGYGPDAFPEGDVKKASNYCRNPSANGVGSGRWLWCYHDSALGRGDWNYCTDKVSQCPCPAGRFGTNCLSECHCSDEDNACNSATGVCSASCHEHFEGVTCQECVDNRFGVHCDKVCHCQDPNEVCNKATGVCSSGCSAGWKGNDCQAECDHGEYGENCAETCSSHCEDPGDCNRTSGICSCQAGFQPPTCHVECDNGKYGQNCAETCSSHCEDPGNCYKISGICVCQAGFQPPTCHAACMDGTFGINCAKNCRCHKDSEVCEKANGTCSESGCAAGWHGQGCHTACPQGKYGRNCFDTCSNHCKESRRCNGTTGHCLCQVGYQPPTCHSACDPGRYGYNCENTCPQNCQNTSDCNPTNGSCSCKVGFYGDQCSRSQQLMNPGPPTSVIAGTVTAFVCIVILAILAAVWYRRRDGDKPLFKGILSVRKSDEVGRRYTEGMADESGNQGREADASSKERRRRGEGTENPWPLQEEYVHADAIYCNVATVFDKKNIAIDMLPDYIRFMTETENSFEDEYKLLPTNPTADIGLGKMEKNRPKNRFRNIVPYSHNRVKLHNCKDDPVDGYINASYIPGYDNTVRFIAAQGPEAVSLDDFILMVWENDVSLIVMVTSLKEDTKAKCEQYWPNRKEPIVFGEITVSLVSTIQSPHYIIRKLVLLKDGQKKRIAHMQFISWPDHGTPQSPTAFLTYLREATKYYDNTRGPVLVHCSAGVGRTGTFIAMDYLLKQAKQDGMISVYNCVKELRSHRVGMVQSLDQYIFIHEALLEALHCGEVVHDVSHFDTWMSGLGRTDELHKQFMMLEKMRREVKPEETVAGRLEENRTKNRNPQLLPLDKWRPLLMMPVPLSNDYINAVFVKFERRGDPILVTQSPMKNTVNDIWRLIHDYECAVVVSLNAFETEDFPEYFATNCYGPFSVRQKPPMSGDGYVKTVLAYTPQGGPKYEIIHLAIDHEAPEGSLPDLTTFLALIEAASHAQQEDRAGRTLVHCRNGVNNSGLFCALPYLSEIKDEHEVDVFHAVKQIRMSRPEFITSLEEYQWLHQAALCYVQSFSTYANFR